MGIYIYIYRLPYWLSGKESGCNAGDTDSIPGSERSPGGEHGKPVQYSCLENTMDRGTWQSMGCKESNTSEVTEQYIHTYIHIYIYNIHIYIHT